jgi:hypothetical protein
MARSGKYRNKGGNCGEKRETKNPRNEGGGKKEKLYSVASAFLLFVT